MPELRVRQNSLQRFLQFVPSSAIGAALFSKVVHYVDRPLMRASGGKLSLPQLVLGCPCVVLSTTGARSGLIRTIPTIGIPDGANVALIASNWGQRRHPSWYYNLQQEPRAVLRFAGHEGTYVGREVDREDEYDRLWKRAVSLYSGYAKYEARAGGRGIAIFVMEPV